MGAPVLRRSLGCAGLRGDNAVLAGPLCLVERLVRGGDELFRRRQVALDRYAEARRHLQQAAVRKLRTRLRDRETKAFRQLGGSLEVALGNEHHELFAAVACGEVDLADAGAEHLADRAQDRVAGQVAVRVVHLLEVVEVEQHESEGVADPVSATPLERELLVEGATVCDPGESVGRRLRGHPAEVAEHAQKRAREQQRDEHEQSEGTDRRVADSVAVRGYGCLDQVLRPKRQETDATRVRDARGHRAVPLALEAYGPVAGRERNARADQPASPDERQAVAAGVGRVAREASAEPLAERLDSDDLADATSVHGQPDGTLEDVLRRGWSDAVLVGEEERNTRLARGDPREHGRALGDERALNVLRAGEIGRPSRDLVAEPAQLP